MRTNLISAAFLVGAVLIAAAPAAAASYRLRGLEVQQPWSRPAVAGTNGIGYMVLANRGPAADVLEKVESPLAARVEMHSSSMAGGVMSMKKEDRLPLPVGGQVTFGPGAYHLMLIGLTRTLAAGDKVPATLSFASGARIKVAFTVGVGSRPPAVAGAAR